MAEAAMDEFTKAYVECALWSSTDDNGKPLDTLRDTLSPDALLSMIEDCRRFQKEHWADIASNPARAGHDYWLTRNGHGAGFWDGDWPKEIGKRLTVASEAAGECTLYIGDTGLIHSFPDKRGQ